MQKIGCSGYSFEAKPFSDLARGFIVDSLDLARKDFLESTSYSCLGMRFHNDKNVILRIESVTNEEEFWDNHAEWIQAGLKDCASADHWYTFEKNWE